MQPNDRKMTSPIPLAEAQQKLLELAICLPPENCSTAQAFGRTLAKPIIANRTQPPADLSAMDGYAVAGTGPWSIIGESRAGHPFERKIAQSEAVSISTGSRMPDGTNAILLREQSVASQTLLSVVEGEVPSKRYIRKAGYDFRRGDMLLEKGVAIDAACIAVGLSAGLHELSVHRQPSVAIMDCGDELVSDVANCASHQIPASNGAMLAAMAREAGASVQYIGPVADRMDALSDALSETEHCDVLVTSGGASIGDHDLIRPALESWEANIAFWRVAMKPGKPLLVATRGRQVILGLPGNPVSSYVTAFLLLLPLLRKLAGVCDVLPKTVMFRSATDIPAGCSRQEFLRAAIDGNNISAMSEQDSGALRALADADALIIRGIDAPESKAGTYVPAYLLRNGGIA